MPSLGFGEILILVLIGLLVFGPRRLPEIGKTVGKSLREFRRAASDLRAEIEEDVDEGRPTFPPSSAQADPAKAATPSAPGTTPDADGDHPGELPPT